MKSKYPSEELHMEAVIQSLREDPLKRPDPPYLEFKDLGTGNSGGDCFFVVFSQLIFDDEGANHCALRAMLGWIWKAMSKHADLICKDYTFFSNVISSCGACLSSRSRERLFWTLGQDMFKDMDEAAKSNPFSWIETYVSTEDDEEEKKTFIAALSDCWADELVLLPGSWGGDMDHHLLSFITEATLFIAKADLNWVHH
jgi:hypothetical protein